MSRMRAVLVTGSAGRIGRAVCAELIARGHRVRGFDRIPSPALADAVVGDVVSPADLARALDGMDTAVHLAATPDEADFLTCLLPNNAALLGYEPRDRWPDGLGFVPGPGGGDGAP